MKTKFFVRSVTTLVAFCVLANAVCEKLWGQLPAAISAEIIEFEDERYFSDRLKQLLSDKNPQIRRRAALAAGRIGDAKALEYLFELLRSEKTRPSAK